MRIVSLLPHTKDYTNPWILKYPDENLRVKSIPVDLSDPKAIMRDYKRACGVLDNSYEDGISISAPQIGIFKRFFIYRSSSGYKCVINPRIRSWSTYEVPEHPEGSLSFSPGYFVHHALRRARDLRVDYWLYPDKIEFTNRPVEGLESQVFQHCMDHFDGILISDYERGDFYGYFD